MSGRILGLFGRIDAWISDVGAPRFVLAFAVVALFSQAALAQSDNPDTWFILATGREIAENGVPHLNPFAPEGSGYAIVVQQWGYCLLSHLCYEAGGWTGVLLMNYCFYLLFFAALAFCARSFGERAPRDRLDSALPTLAMGALTLAIVRPHSLTVAAWLFEVGAFERYRRGDARYLKVIPAVAVVHANMHVSMAPVDVAVACAYLFAPSGRAGGRPCGDGCRRGPVAAVAASCLAALFLTPYGVDGAALLASNAGGARGFISECLPSYDPGCAERGPASVLVSMPIAVAYALACVRGRRVDPPSMLMFAGSFALTLAYSRCSDLLIVAWVPACAWAIDCGGESRDVRASVSLAAVVCALYVAWSVLMPQVMLAAARPFDSELNNATKVASSPVDGVDALEALGAEPGDLVLTSFYTGGYLEYRGYRVTLDTRYEIWTPGGAKAEACTAYADFADSVFGDEAAADRYVAAWEDDAEWAVVGYESARLKTRYIWEDPAHVDGFRERSIIGRLDSSPRWERVHGAWDTGERAGFPPYYVYRKVS